VTLLLLESLGLPSYGAQLNTLRPFFMPRLRNLWVIDTSRWRRGPQVAYRLQA
jgi:hypothetical protein